ncbi:MAG: hypothetical protein EPN86_03290 [Nanoarchaeota archaeon]|nr:MAG: hypothetical protein EPN86_03290 [Nanoarchaeota archaeon]
MDLISAWSATYAHNDSNLKLQLRRAHIRELPSKFVRKAVFSAIYLSAALSFVTFLFVQRFRAPLLFIPAVGLLSFVFGLLFLMNTPTGIIRKRERETDEEILFVGRYILVKLESGEPLYNTLIDAAKMKGASAKYIKEIVDDISTGKPLEKAIEDAWEFNSSEKFRRILFQILSALKTGTELAPVLKSTLRSLTYQQILEVKEYGKKLNTYMMFYLILACILPSLGVTMLVVFSSFIRLDLQQSSLFVIIFFLALVQAAFILVIKASRPAVNL